MPFSYRTIDGGLHIVDACPADTGPTRVWPVQVPGGRLILVAQRHDEARRFDGRTIVAGAHHWGISRYDLLSGEAYPLAAGEQASAIWDVTMATLPGGRAVVAGAGYDGLVYRWDAATGERIGERAVGTLVRTIRMPPVSSIWIPVRRRAPAPGSSSGPDPGRRQCPGCPRRSRPPRSRPPGRRRMRLPGASISLFRHHAERRERAGRTRADPPLGAVCSRDGTAYNARGSG